jgi:DNA invertase Pin-like site-specific DNA recombinase
MIYGYARVSTSTQGRDGNSLEDQVAALEKYGCQKIIEEAFSGKTMERPKFQRLLKTLKEGDTLVVCKLDRFARTAIEGVQTVRELFDRGIRVHILNMGLIENTLTGNLILTVMLAFAEYERGMIVERTQTGKAVAKLDPNFKDGRPPKFTQAQLQLGLLLLAQGNTYKQVTAKTGISKSTLIRYQHNSSQKVISG